MTLSNSSSRKKAPAPPAPPSSSFLTKLSTLRDFVNGMGIKASENQLWDTLKQSSYNVELALERILTGNFGSGGGGGDDGLGAPNNNAMSSTPSMTASKKRGRSATKSAASLSSSTTPKSASSSKRQKHGGGSSAPSSSNRKIGSATATNRLLLCKRWTVACSKTNRGRVNYGESLDFTENWSKNHNNNNNNDKQHTKKKPMDPMVRFHSSSGYVEGTLNRYLCSILSPLLRLPATTTTHNGGNEFIPLVSIEGEALMEDRHLVIGSEVPISLKIYVNDPVGFFDLFQQSRSSGGGVGVDDTSSSKLFFQKNNGSKNDGGGSRMPSYQGKKVKSSFSEDELAEAAFHLLQWADKGEEMPFVKDSMKEGDEVVGKKSIPGGGDDDNVVDMTIVKSDNSAKKADKNDDDDGGDSTYSSKTNSLDDDDPPGDDGDYEDENSLVSEQVDELNQLVVVSEKDQQGKTKKTLPELSDPICFKKSGIVLRPYQRQALYWMCRREGTFVEGEMDKEDEESDDGGDGELDLLAELASSSSSSSGADASIQVWGGKAIACDCGPVVVSDESVSSRALPVIEYGQKRNGDEAARKYVHHPLWKRRFLATDDLGSVFAFYVNELLGIASATPPNPPKQCVGGILADAMGLGKTVMLLSLILKTKEAEAAGEMSACKKEVKSERSVKRKAGTAPKKEDIVDLSFEDDESESDCQVDDDESWSDEQNQTIAKKTSIKAGNSKGTTLVIAPLSLISQWEEEMASKTDLSHLVYYDSAKKATGGDTFSCVDVVVTTYGTIQSEFASLSRMNGGSMEPGQSHPLLQFDWKRIILDEAHGIKNPSTVVSKACCMLKAQTRWTVSGTPIQNSLQDVYGLLKFLRHEPWSEATFWKNAITNSLSGASTGAGNASTMVKEDDTAAKKESSSGKLVASAAFGRVRRVLAPIILRRTKDTLTEDGTPILSLPPIDFSLVNVTLSPPEREFYSALLERSQSVFEGFLKSGTASKSWFAIFSLLQRLRQSCNHVSLTVNKKLDKSELARLRDSHEVVRAELSSNEVGEGAVDDSFLSDLLTKFKKNNNAVANANEAFATQVAQSLSQCVQSSEYLTTECPICLDEPRVDDAVHTPCAHMFCRKCLLSEFEEQVIRSNKKTANNMLKNAGASNLSKIEGGSCPVCNEYVKSSCIIQIEKSENGELVSKYLNQLPESEKENSPNTSTEILQRDVVARETLELALNGASSSKLEAVTNELDEVWSQDPGSKILIFSQYLGFLDIIGGAMDELGVECFRIDGKMSLKERIAMIGKFNKNRTSKQTSFSEEGVCQRGSVFLVSMKAGGVGLNLVAASSVFICDPWWNQAIEDQCINRIHRIGQHAKVVRVRKFVVTDSVEEKIVSLQEKKKGMANEILSDADSGGQLDSTKPTLEDFKLLFGR
ncbi:hypothetical protein ACHAXR_010079 [Thalassiosira sp. AJA248-18]